MAPAKAVFQRRLSGYYTDTQSAAEKAMNTARMNIKAATFIMRALQAQLHTLKHKSNLQMAQFT